MNIFHKIRRISSKQEKGGIINNKEMKGKNNNLNYKGTRVNVVCI